MDDSTYVDSGVIRLQDQLVFAKVNGWEDTVLARKFGIAGYPTTILLDLNGQEIDRFSGYLPAPDFIKQINDYQAGIGTLMSYEKRLLNEPENIEVLMKLGEKYEERSRFTDAIAKFLSVASLDPDNKKGKTIEATYNIADSYYRWKKFKEAVPVYQQVIDKFPNTELALEAVLMIPYMYEKMADTTHALELYKKLLADYPNHPDKDWVQKRITKFTSPVATEKQNK